MMIKGMAAVIAICFLAIGILSWQMTRLEDKNADLVETNGKLEQANAQLVQDVKDQNETIAGLREQISINDEVITKNAADKQAFANDNQRLKKELEKLKNEKPEIRDYLNQHKPAAVVGMLRSLWETGSGTDQDGDIHSPSTIQPDGADSEARAGLPDERMWRSTYDRLQHPAGLMQC